MERKKLEVNWHLGVPVDFEMPLRRYRRYLEDQGFRESTLESYVGNVGRYLKFAKTDRPTTDTATCFRDTLHDKNLARSTINNYSFAMACYHSMYGEEVSFPFMKRNDEIPYYFDGDEVARVFSACNNLKHLAMLQTLFYPTQIRIHNPDRDGFADLPYKINYDIDNPESKGYANKLYQIFTKMEKSDISKMNVHITMKSGTSQGQAAGDSQADDAQIRLSAG